jgi:hypothetical protein
MVSEDSDQFWSGSAMVHRLSDLNDLEQPVRRQMVTRRDAPHARRELLEVLALGGPERMRFEEWDDHFEQIREPANSILQEILSVVVVPPVAIDEADTEELLELFQRSRATRALRHDKPMNHLEAGSVAGTSGPIGLTDEADGEASFPIYETDDPASLDQPFLLIARTARIVTAHTAKGRASTGRILGVSSI